MIREGLQLLPDSETRPRLTGRDWLGALGICILVILSTFPVVIPFLVLENAQTALRISNAIAVLSLYFCGVIFARHAGLRPWPTGLIMLVVGVALVGMAITLGDEIPQRRKVIEINAGMSVFGGKADGPWTPRNVR